MVRKAIVAVTLISAASANAGTLPNFEFRDAVAGTVGKIKAFGDCHPSSANPKETICADFQHPGTIAGKPLHSLAAFQYQRRLTSIYGTFETSDFKAIAEAFNAKYGAPCEHRVEDWESRMGVKTETPVITWCFLTGKLELYAIGDRIDEGRISYLDKWEAPKPPPTVDF